MASTACPPAQSASDRQQAPKGSPSSQTKSLGGAGESISQPLEELRKAGSKQKHELLFAAWDTNDDGIVDFPELASGLRKLNPEDTGLADAARAAIAALVEFDTDKNRRLDKEEFRAFVTRLARNMGSTFEAVAELLIVTASAASPEDAAVSSSLQLMQGKAEEQVKQAQHTKTLSDDPRIERLFVLFDRSGTGEIDFQNLILMLKKLRPGGTLKDVRAAAVNAMLLCDSNSNRSLDRSEFARFIQRLALLMQRDCCVLAEDLLGLAARPDSPWGEGSETTFPPEDSDATSQIYETLADRKLHLLFELWDKDGDGHISFAELALGLRKFSAPDESVTVTAEDAAEALAVFDVDADQKLDRADFARFVNQFCNACGADFHTLAEFLILLAALEDNPGEELAFLLSEDKVNGAVLDVDQIWRTARSTARSHHPDKTSDGQIGADATPQQPGESPGSQDGHGVTPQQPSEHPVRQTGNAAATASVGPSPFATKPTGNADGRQEAVNDLASAGVLNDSALAGTADDSVLTPSDKSQGPSGQDAGNKRKSQDGKGKSRRPSVSRAREPEQKSDHPPRVIASQE